MPLPTTTGFDFGLCFIYALSLLRLTITLIFILILIFTIAMVCLKQGFNHIKFGLFVANSLLRTEVGDN